MVLLPLSQTHIEESLGHILQAVKITSPRKASRKIITNLFRKGKMNIWDPRRLLGIHGFPLWLLPHTQQVILSRLDPRIKSLSVQCDPQSSFGQRVSCFAFFQVNNSKQGAVPFLNKVATESGAVSAHWGVIYKLFGLWGWVTHLMGKKWLTFLLCFGLVFPALIFLLLLNYFLFPNACACFKNIRCFFFLFRCRGY